MASEKRKASDTTILGSSDLEIGWLGMGAWAWGGRFVWGKVKPDDMQAAFEASLDAGVNFIDTAEVYGSGRSEQYVGEFLKATDHRGRIVIATKFAPLPRRLMKSAFHVAVDYSLKRLGIDQIDLYQIHFPLEFRPIDFWVEALADAIEIGKVRYGGVSNFSVGQTMRAHTILAGRGFPLLTNQVRYSLLDRHIEHSGLLDLCKELNITILAYSPLAQGLLTGKYSPENPPPGVRRWQYSQAVLRKVQPLIGLMREIGQAHAGKSPAQVALNWTICKSTVPIPGAKNARQAKDNVGALGWRLTDAEVAALDQASDSLFS